MAMSHNGLVKLSEEGAEVIQVAQKMIAYPELQLHGMLNELHPDGTNLRLRLQEEMGDLYAALKFVSRKLHLDFGAIRSRALGKLETFERWDLEE